jgi:hypothetical protein
VDGPGQHPDPKYAARKGIAYGIRKGRFGDALRVKMGDFSFDYVHSFTAIGIGAYCHAPVAALRET